MKEELNSEVENTPKIGSWKGGMLLVRASWSTLKMDKELVLFPIFSAVTSLVILCLIGLVIWLSGLVTLADFASDQGPAIFSDWRGYIILFFCYLGVAISSNFFAASIISSALHRFKGEDPDINYGIAQAKKCFGSLLRFSLVSATIGLILRTIEDKASWAGRIAASLFGIAWSLATIFVVPVIVTNEKPVGPIDAIKKSAEVFKKVWTKNAAGGLGMGLFFLLVVLIWMVLSTACIIGSIFVQPVLLFAAIPLSIIGLVIVISFASALSSVFQAALYHYATVGESPVEFDKNLLKAAFRPKGKWFA